MFALTLLASSLLLGGQTWTVDDDGPADFSDLPEAIAAVSPGDILLVEPGNYSSATLDKELTILGRPGASRPDLRELKVESVGGFTLAGLELNGLVVRDVSGRGRIDDCFVHDSGFDVGEYGVFKVEDCDEILISRCEIQGIDDDGFTTFGSNGLEIFRSAVEMVDCEIRGGHGYFILGSTTAGWRAVYCRDSEVRFSGCSIQGGAGGSLQEGGHGIVLKDSVANLRGSSSHVIQGGSGSGGPPSVAVLVGGSSTLPFSGVTLLPSAPSSGTEIVPAEPFLLVTGEDGPGMVRVLEMYGPAGTVALIEVSARPELDKAPGIPGGPAWIDVDAIVAILTVTLAGQDTAATQSIHLPGDPALAGLVGEVQGTLLPAPDGLYLTNASQIILRF